MTTIGSAAVGLRHRWRNLIAQRLKRDPGEHPPVLDPAEWQGWIKQFRHAGLPSPPVLTLEEPDGKLEISCCGASWRMLEPHLLLQLLPLPWLQHWSLLEASTDAHRIRLQRKVARTMRSDAVPCKRICINLELPPPERVEPWLAHLRAQTLIWDPDPARAGLLRRLQLPVGWLDTKTEANGWLNGPLAGDAGAWARQLGLAPVRQASLVVLGAAGRAWDQAISREAALPTSDPSAPVIDYLPGWHELIIETVQDARLQAGWLQEAAERAARLFVSGVPQLPETWLCLQGLQHPPLTIAEPITPDDLRALHLGRPLQVLAEDRPQPPVDQLFHWSDGREPTASVLVSLHNYAECIEAALNSAATQIGVLALELIVVDDASSDQGAALVHGWMAAWAARPSSQLFTRLLLLRHRHNSGLAAARNSAFVAAQAPWCFVLDADNWLLPNALQACLDLATIGSDDLAVVHPLLAVEVEPGRPDDQRSLVSTASWQRQRLAGGNVVDAMALVRRSAWQAVSGYTHIEGGWEDFDFWCKLLAAGWHGVQCPRVLAVYRSHPQSMSYTTTNRSWRALSRTLQDRHPWLQLPLATP